MALKKSDLYSSLWASCDELRGGMDASQYKDYVLFMLFIKYISDKYGDSSDFAPPVTISKGASFTDIIALTGKSDIGDKINTQVIQPLIDANERLARSTSLYRSWIGRVISSCVNRCTQSSPKPNASPATGTPRTRVTNPRPR